MFLKFNGVIDGVLIQMNLHVFQTTSHIYTNIKSTSSLNTSVSL